MGSDFTVINVQKAVTTPVPGLTGSLTAPPNPVSYTGTPPSGLNAGAVFGILILVIAIVGCVAFGVWKVMSVKKQATPMLQMHQGHTVGTPVGNPPPTVHGMKAEKQTTELIASGNKAAVAEQI